jgi:serine/threonine protein kinase
MSNDAEQAAQASAGGTYRMLRELGSRAQHSHAAIREPNELVVAQRFVRGARSGNSAELDADDATPLDAEAMALLLRDARCLAKNWHPNIARVRHVDLTSKPRNVLTIASELLDGSTLEDLIEAAQPERTSARDPLLALPVLVRVLLDVLSGLHALHGLRDGMNAPLGAIHGELCPANVVVGKDGVARIVNVLRRRPVRVGASSEALAYAAPEALDGGGTNDPRCDVYAVGVMLWEGVAGRGLYEEREPSQILARQREGELLRPSIHPSSPFARLADVAMRALSFDPALRYRGVTDMAADLRKIAGTKLATGATVALRVSDLAGDRIRMRRALLEPATSGTRRRASERSIAVAEESIDTARQSALTADEIALAKGIDPGAVVFVPSLPPLPPPVTQLTPLTRPMRQLTRRVSPHRASMQRIAPTLERDIPVALIAASRRTAELDDAVDVDMDAADIAEPARAEPASTEALIEAALATTTAQMRAVAFERRESAPELPATETPGDFVIPIDVTETWNEPAPRPRPRPRPRMAGIGVIAALVLLAMGGFLAMHARTAPAEPAASSAAPFPAMALSPTVATPPDPTAAETASATASAPASAPAAPSSTSARPAPRTVGPTAPLPPAKPKKSIYEPEGL